MHPSLIRLSQLSRDATCDSPRGYRAVFPYFGPLPPLEHIPSDAVNDDEKVIPLNGVEDTGIEKKVQSLLDTSAYSRNRLGGYVSHANYNIVFTPATARSSQHDFNTIHT